MTYARVMGICVTDEEEYSNYRKGMLPILQSYGGSFGYDFKVSEVLKAKTDEPINRVFTIAIKTRVRVTLKGGDSIRPVMGRFGNRIYIGLCVYCCREKLTLYKL